MSIPHGDITTLKQDMTALNGCPWCRGFMIAWCSLVFLPCVMILVGDEEQKVNVPTKSLGQVDSRRPHSPSSRNNNESMFLARGGGGGFPFLRGV